VKRTTIRRAQKKFRPVNVRLTTRIHLLPYSARYDHVQNLKPYTAMGKKCIVLTSNMANGLAFTAQKNMIDKLDGEKIAYENVEAVEQVDRRNELFGISGKKGLFPQVRDVNLPCSGLFVPIPGTTSFNFNCVTLQFANLPPIHPLSPLYAFTTQLFFEENGTVTFFGDAEAVNDLFETDSLPKEVLDQNPDLPTFSRVFGDVARK